ncbi:chorion peroxidase-like [Branchiostoma floridae x Branchiostoma japonicum]
MRARCRKTSERQVYRTIDHQDGIFYLQIRYSLDIMKASLAQILLVIVAMISWTAVARIPTDEELRQAIDLAKERLEQRTKALSGGDNMPVPTSVQLKLGTIHRSTPMSVELSQCAWVLENVAEHFMGSEYNVSFEALTRIESTNLTSMCDVTSMKPVTCDPPAIPEFRSADGRCNNRAHPLWGSAEQPQKRLLPSEYSDGFTVPRMTARSGASLPSARLVSATLHEDFRKTSSVNSYMVMQFGQFLDHDITLTPNFQEEGLVCECGSQDDRCFNIPVPTDDEDFASEPCITFARSRSSPNEGCRMGPRQQINQITAFIDASNVYGSSEEEMEVLRDMDKHEEMRGPNLALGRPTQQSSVAFGGVPERAVDGNTNAVYSSRSCTHTENTDNNWWYVDLGSSHYIDEVVIFNRQDCCTERLNSFQLHVGDSPDVASNPSCGGNHVVTRGQETIPVDCGGRQGRYVGVFLPTRQPLTLCEVQVYEEEGLCPLGYTRYRRNCFKATQTAKDFDSAAASCAEDGGILATPKDNDTNTFLVHLKNQVSTEVPFWFGLSDRHVEGEWRWEDGTLLQDGAFTNWLPGEPEISGREDCVNFLAGTGSKWNDVPCRRRRGYICQVELIPKSPRGLLKSRPNPTDSEKKELLPGAMAEEFEMGCPEHESDGTETCSQAGDVRVNEQPGLTSMHTVFLREHNRIARQLSTLNPLWNEDRVFLETRKIIGALMQKIVYGEDLPNVLGPDAMAKFNLSLTENGFYHGYDENANPTISNAFSTAAYRFGHSLVDEKFTRATPDYAPGAKCPIQLAMSFFNPSHIFDNDQGGPDSIIRGLVSQASGLFDRFMVSDLTKHLFADPPGSVGLDLAALNIQRGRDHGLPGYNAWRERCGLSRAHGFDDLEAEIPDWVTRHRLSSVYTDVDDIDLFAGGLAEKSVPGGVVGPTFACLIGLQFQELRVGDRFWFENSGQFTTDQLAEIKNTTLARILCDNTDGTTHMQPDVFRLPRAGNDMVACSALHQIDLTKWQV